MVVEICSKFLPLFFGMCVAVPVNRSCVLSLTWISNLYTAEYGTQSVVPLALNTRTGEDIPTSGNWINVFWMSLFSYAFCLIYKQANGSLMYISLALVFFFRYTKNGSTEANERTKSLQWES